jgi:hypothetical protein
VLATLKLTRKAIGMELRRGLFDVLVDGKRVGPIERQDTIETPVEPGRHTLQVRKGRYSSRNHAFDVADGQVISFRCHGANIWPIWLVAFAVPSLVLKLIRELSAIRAVGAQRAAQLAITAVALMILVAVGTVGFALQAPTSLGGFTLAAALTITAVFALGLWIAGTAKTAASAGAITWAAFFPLMFFARRWVPVQQFPAALRDLANYGAPVEALQHAINNRARLPASSRPHRLQQGLRLLPPQYFRRQ